ncbi:MAG: hypothetical protein Q3M24_02250 [Candidatus Electrothrix aestuarii]|uniref:Uncharacterized protein n=1 Tax=Candidatus Electrothrix aestuarii TaxID=3062594 RepID=A0AAU8LWI3_9BACT|nr:hypothetical protein [Candidatus Electrothrix aestuarii]
MSSFKGKMKKCRLPIILLVLGLFTSPLIYKAWVKHQAKTKEAVARETGLQLPSGVEVQAAQVQLFSLADGINYDWLLSGSTSLIPWARSVGRNETQYGTGWKKIKTFQQICPFINAAFEEVSLHSVWRIIGALPDKKATCFLYLAEDEKTGLLSTFNP